MAIRILVLDLILCISCTTKDNVLLPKDLKVNELSFSKLAIKRGTIYFGNQYYINDHMIITDRRKVMDQLYFLKGPYKLSKSDTTITIDSGGVPIKFQIQYSDD